jgi:hypothetical protein
LQRRYLKYWIFPDFRASKIGVPGTPPKVSKLFLREAGAL